MSVSAAVVTSHFAKTASISVSAAVVTSHFAKTASISVSAAVVTSHFAQTACTSISLSARFAWNRSAMAVYTSTTAVRHLDGEAETAAAPVYDMIRTCSPSGYLTACPWLSALGMAFVHVPKALRAEELRCAARAGPHRN